MLRRYRRIWRYRRRLLQPTLVWTCPGTVWAVDFSEPPQPIEGQYGHLLAVRDLASGCQLAWLPVLDESATSAMAGLETLFLQYRPPLVLKSDNGSAFVADDFAAFLDRWQVAHLFSPPRTPQYNGSCEAGIGSMKTRTHHQAAVRGCPGAWSCDDVEAARLAANYTARPWGSNHVTPEEAWQRRATIAMHVRSAFMSRVDEELQEERQKEGYLTETKLARTSEAAIRRMATRQVLVAHDLLRFS